MLEKSAGFQPTAAAEEMPLSPQREREGVRQPGELPSVSE